MPNQVRQSDQGIIQKLSIVSLFLRWDDAGKYQKWPVSFKILKILIFCLNNLYYNIIVPLMQPSYNAWAKGLK